MFWVAGLVAIILAGVCELLKTHLTWVIWLVIVSGLGYGIHLGCGWYGTRRSGPNT